jgi:GLPGLI family protein
MRILFFLIIFQFYSGQNNINFIQYYTVDHSSSATETGRDSFMFFNHSEKIYFNFLYQRNQVYKTMDYQNLDPSKILNSTDELIKTLDADNKILETKYDCVKGKNYLTEDRYSVSWEIKNETKKILNFTCRKAVAKFRGRVWIAWFTPEISSKFGPWKLDGLPGLILEAYDDKKTFTMEAIKIGLHTSYTFPSSIVDYFSKQTKMIPYLEFIKIENRNLEELQNQIYANQTKGTGNDSDRIPLRYLLPEITFEWENPKTK